MRCAREECGVASAQGIGRVALIEGEGIRRGERVTIQTSDITTLWDLGEGDMWSGSQHCTTSFR